MSLIKISPTPGSSSSANGASTLAGKTHRKRRQSRFSCATRQTGAGLVPVEEIRRIFLPSRREHGGGAVRSADPITASRIVNY
jgi:hypothetical protein